jgi:hypothetical protein
MKFDQGYSIMGSIVTLLLAMQITPCHHLQANTAENPIEKTGTAPLPARQLVFDKLTGTWRTENGRSFERWTKNDDGTFRSVAFSVKGSDTSWNENAVIYPENDKWVFENTVRGQNDGKSVKFFSSFFNENSVQFSNPAHDFPTDINYTLKDKNTVKAFIVGPNKKGGKDTIPFNYTRVK